MDYSRTLLKTWVLSSVETAGGERFSESPVYNTWHRRRAEAGGATMKLRIAGPMAAVFLLATVLVGQLHSAPSSAASSQRQADECPFPPGGKIAQFDTSLYLQRANGVKLGRPLSAPDPGYSETARQKKIQGCVLLAVAINAGGTVDLVKVVQVLEPGLDQKAVEAVQKWKFTPATKDGNAVAVQIPISVGFRLY
jgi:TonB family protein